MWNNAWSDAWSDASSPGHGAGAGRVLKAASVQLRRTDPLSVPVEQRLAEAAEAAFRDGYEEGFTAGATQAGAELLAAVDDLRRAVLGAIEADRAAARQARAADAERLVELALAVAEWAVRRELTAVPEAFFGRLAELLTDRDRHDRVEVITSPALAEPTRRWLDDPAVRVGTDSALADGEARVVLDDTTVFATFADAFEQARAALDRAVLQQPDPPGTPGGQDRAAAPDGGAPR